MNSTKTFRITILILSSIILGLAFYSSSLHNKLSRISVSTTTKLPDTVYVNKPLSKPKPLPIPEKPTQVVFWKTDTLTEERFDTIRIPSGRDTIYLYRNQDLDSLAIATNFLLNYPTAEKLIFFRIQRKLLTLGLYSLEGIPKTLELALDINQYNYLFQDGEFTKERYSGVFKTSSEKYLNLTYRPLNQFWDLDLGISFKTWKLNYGGGINMFYYPLYKPQPGMDIYFRAGFKF